jgi:hypothetical protein
LLAYLLSKNSLFGKVGKLFGTVSGHSSASDPLHLYRSCILPHDGLRDANLECELSIFHWSLSMTSGTESTYDPTTAAGSRVHNRSQQHEHTTLSCNNKMESESKDDNRSKLKS